MVLSEEAFASVVRDGILSERGMPEFADLRDRQLLAIRHYIRYSAENPPSNPTGSEGNKPQRKRRFNDETWRRPMKPVVNNERVIQRADD